jgi:hypothetical protein
VKELCKQIRNEPDPSQRLPADYKFLRKMIMEMPFFKRPINEPQMSDEEAMEIVRHIKVRYYPPKRHIYLPDDTTHESFYILSGKVLVGVKKHNKAADIIPEKYIEKKKETKQIDERASQKSVMTEQS